VRIRIHAPSSADGLGERDLMNAYRAMSGVKIRAERAGP
jgi:hypothetical protein